MVATTIRSLVRLGEPIITNSSRLFQSHCLSTSNFKFTCRSSLNYSTNTSETKISDVENVESSNVQTEKMKNSILYHASAKRAEKLYNNLLKSRNVTIDKSTEEQDKFYINQTTTEFMKLNPIPQYIVTDPRVKTKAELTIEQFFRNEGTVNSPTSSFFVNDYEDYRIRLFTNFIMRKGNKLVARRNVMEMLKYINEATRNDPVLAVTTALEKTQPLVRSVVFKRGNNALIIPLNRSKRMKSAVKYIVRATPKKTASHVPFFKVLGREVLRVLRGTSAALKQRHAVHSRVLLHSKFIRPEGRFNKMSNRRRVR